MTAGPETADGGRDTPAFSAVPSPESRITNHELARTTPVDVERVETRPAEGGIDISVLVPAKDEADNLPRFMELAATALEVRHVK